MKTSSLLVAITLVLVACNKPDAPAPIASAETAATETGAPAAVPPPTGPVTPSFECSKAESEAEKLVCSDYSLAAHDNRLAELYAAALANPEASDDLAATQRGWVKGRDDCWKADDKKTCIAEAYMTRIAELQINSPGAVAATPVEFTCNDDSKPLAMAYYNAYDNTPAVITLGSDQTIIFPQNAASGARYGRTGISFWEHQGKVSVDFFGIKLECTALPPSTNF